jgi:hypothetical protein
LALVINRSHRKEVTNGEKQCKSTFTDGGGLLAFEKIAKIRQVRTQLVNGQGPD